MTKASGTECAIHSLEGGHCCRLPWQHYRDGILHECGCDGEKFPLTGKEYDVCEEIYDEGLIETPRGSLPGYYVCLKPLNHEGDHGSANAR